MPNRLRQYFAAIALISGLAFPAAAQSVDTEELCKTPSVPALKLYWPALVKAYPITPPAQAILMAPSQPMAQACSVDRALIEGKSGFSSFQAAMTACGFTTATTFALVFEEEDFCKIADETPYCAGLIGMRNHLNEKLNEANDGLGAPEDKGSYAFELSSAYSGLGRPAQRRKLLLEIYAWSSDPDPKTGARLLCSPVLPKPGTIDLPKPISIAKDSRSVAQLPGYDRKLSELKPLEVALNLDRQNRTVTERDASGNPVRSEYNDLVSVNGAIGHTLMLNRESGENPDIMNDSLITLYTSLDYAERFDPTKETDNFAFGFIVFPQFGLNRVDSPIGNPRIDVRWITDIEERDSAQWKFDAATEIFALGTPDAWVSWSPILWDAEAMIDYTHVVSPGDKVALANVGEAFRTGYNISWTLRDTLFEHGNFAPSLSGSYRYRDTLGSGPGNADLVTVDLGLLKYDEKAGGLGLALGYERGENLDSLEQIETVKLKLQIKN
jgi:hypothetical protein